MTRSMPLIGLIWMSLSYNTPASGQGPTAPDKASSFESGPNKMPLTLESFCAGVPNVMAMTTQNIANEVAILCPNGIPSQLFRDIVASPYQGSGATEDFMQELDEDDLDGQVVQVKFAYGVRMAKSTVPAVIKEEPIAILPYNGNVLKIQNQFVEPPKNTGDAETSFFVEQSIDVNRPDRDIEFKDTSKHHLKMYQMFPNNFDFFMAARTLDAQTEQFKHSVVIRGFMTDPNDADAVISFNIVNIIMNSRGNPNGNVAEGTVETFLEFFQQSIAEAYQVHMNEVNL